MNLEVGQSARIWTQEISMCALRKVPFIGSAAEVAHAVRQRYVAAQADDRLSQLEVEVTAFQSQMRDLVEEAVTSAMQTLRQTQLDGTTLAKLIGEFRDINEAGYNTALFEGIFLGSSHYGALKQTPQGYGSVLNPGAVMEAGHFPIMIELDGQDRILAVPPASLAHVLSEISGQGESSIVAHNDVFAMNHGLERQADETQFETAFNERDAIHDDTITDEMVTMLDLARAYIDMGDSDSAAHALKDIAAHGNPLQQTEAAELLKELK